MPDRPRHKVSVRHTPQIPPLMRNSRRVLARIDLQTGIPAARDLRLPAFQAAAAAAARGGGGGVRQERELRRIRHFAPRSCGDARSTSCTRNSSYVMLSFSFRSAGISRGNGDPMARQQAVPAESAEIARSPRFTFDARRWTRYEVIALALSLLLLFFLSGPWYDVRFADCPPPGFYARGRPCQITDITTVGGTAAHAYLWVTVLPVVRSEEHTSELQSLR